MNSNLICKAVRYALLAGAASAVATPAVFAADATTTAAASTDQSTAQLGKIEVTGTRIKRTTVETAQPITIVTAQQIKASGFASIGDVLQNLTSEGAAVNNQINNGNGGVESFDLRNLGAQRILVLVNGRRWAPQIDNIVDFYTIPASIIDHVEILQDGASAIYGSDAIAGVVNVITVKNYSGAEASAYMGMFHGDGHNDGKKQIYDFTIGSSGDKSGVVMNVSYTNEAPVWAGNRTISKESVYGVGGGSSSTPAGRFIVSGSACAAVQAANPAVSLTSSGFFCDLTNGKPGTAAKPALSQFRNFTGADEFNYAPLNYLLAPSERVSFYAQAHYDIADNLTFSSEILFNNRNSQQSLAPAPFFLGNANNGQTNSGVNIGVAAGNPYNPFGVDLVPYFNSGASAASFASWCATYGSPNCDTTGVTALVLRRRPMEAGNRLFNQNFDTYHWAGGFKGYFNLGGNEWDWDANAIFNNNFENNTTEGQFNTQRLQESLDQNCGTAADPTCVPFDLFGGDVPGQTGTITPAMAAYAGFEEHKLVVDNIRDYTANINGDIADLPAGPLGLALGYEYLEHDGYNHPDALVSLGNTTDNVATPTNGRVGTDAEYFEFDIPLVADAPGMKDVSLDIADRFSQFKWGGVGPNQVFVPGAAHNSSGRAALRWQATDDLLLRGSWSQGFRVPSISEFYAGESNNFPAVTDPCDAGGLAATNAAVAANCAANGHPYSPGNKQTNGQIQSLGGGNASMVPERSISKTLGFVWSPDTIPGYDLSIDYYDIKVGNDVSTFGAQNIVNGCYYADAPLYCNLLAISARGTAAAQINSIKNFNTNVGQIQTDGFDVSTHYKFPSGNAGDFKLGLDITFLKRYDATTPDPISVGGFDTSRLAGWVNFPKKRATLSLDWHYGDWSVNYSMYYVDHTIEPCTNANVSPTQIAAVCSFSGVGGRPFLTYGPAASNPLPGFGALAGAVNHPNSATGLNHIGATTYNDIAFTYHMDGINSDLNFGVQNLFGKQPPVSISAFANTYEPFYNRIPGQFLYGRLSVKF